MLKDQAVHPLRRPRQPVKLIALAAAAAIACYGSETSPDQMTVTGEVRVDGVAVGVARFELEKDGVVIQGETANSYRFIVAAGRYTVRIVAPDGTYCLVTAQAVEGKAGETVRADFACSKAFNASLVAAHDHNTGTPGQSKGCGKMTTTDAPTGGGSSLQSATPLPAVIGAGAAYTVVVTGPTEGGASGIIAGQPPIAGVLGVDGTARYEIRINRFGTYSSTATITSVLGVVRTASASNTVGAAAGVCP